MTTQSPAQRFADALQQLESSRDDGPLRELFADQAELVRPEVSGSSSASSEVGEFWQEYLRQFSEIRTEFGHVAESDEHASLEWTSQGRLATGRDIHYRGVSLLTFDGDARISRFATYYDTAAFLTPNEDGTGA